MKQSEIMVSISCTVYNHGPYLRKCLEGFVMQKTSFPFEVLIHDDASTDNSADIIREFEAKYPHIIKPIYQQENQYSQKVDIWEKYQYTRVRGKYLALCEGDDYWSDANKLQLQVDYMEAHPECVMTCHNSLRHYCDTGLDRVENPYDAEGDVSPAEVIFHKPNCWPATASMVYRFALRKEWPDFLKGLPIGDYPLRLLCVAKGAVHYFDKVMCVYNFGVEGSWTKRQKPDKIKSFNQQMIDMLAKYNEYTGYRFDAPVRQAIERYEYDLYWADYDFKKLIRHPMLQSSKKLLLVASLGCVLPGAAKALMEWRRRKS